MAKDSTTRHRGDWDWAAAGSFIGAGILGLGTIANNIRKRFYDTFVMGYGETLTPFSDIARKYNGAHGMPNVPDQKTFDLSNATEVERLGLGEFDKLSIEHAQGRWNAKEFIEKRTGLTKDFRREIAQKLESEYHLPTGNVIKDWTVGTWKRWRLLGEHSRMDTSLGFAAVTAIALGGFSILRHDKRTLDRIEDKLDDTQQQRSRA